MLESIVSYKLFIIFITFVSYYLLNTVMAKILLVPHKCKIIMMLSNHSFFQYCYRNIGFLSVTSYKFIAFNLLCLNFAIIYLLLCFISLFIVMALPTIARAIVIALISSYRFPLLYSIAFNS